MDNVTYTLVVINTQGASDETHGLESMADVRAQVATWADPENLEARVWTSDGEQVYDGPANEI